MMTIFSTSLNFQGSILCAILCSICTCHLLVRSRCCTRCKGIRFRGQHDRGWSQQLAPATWKPSGIFPPISILSFGHSPLELPCPANHLFSSNSQPIRVRPPSPASDAGARNQPKFVWSPLLSGPRVGTATTFSQPQWSLVPQARGIVPRRLYSSDEFLTSRFPSLTLSHDPIVEPPPASALISLPSRISEPFARNVTRTGSAGRVRFRRLWWWYFGLCSSWSLSRRCKHQHLGR